MLETRRGEMDTSLPEMSPAELRGIAANLALGIPPTDLGRVLDRAARTIERNLLALGDSPGGTPADADGCIPASRTEGHRAAIARAFRLTDLALEMAGSESGFAVKDLLRIALDGIARATDLAERLPSD